MISFINPTEEAPPGLSVRLIPSGVRPHGWPWQEGTWEAIIWLENHVQPGSKVCDIGAGTGILSFVASALGAHVTAYEEDEAARVVILENLKLNPWPIILREEYDGKGGFDLVVANLGNADYEGMGILRAGKEVWTSGEAS